MINDLAIYHDNREPMKTGDVIAFEGTDYGARLIMWGTKSKYSHVGLVVRITDVSADRVFIAESVTNSGVVLLPLSRKLEGYKGKAWWLALKTDAVENEEDKSTLIYKWAMLELGKKYDFKLIGSLVKNIFFKCVLPPPNKNEYICSEFVATAFKEVNILPDNLSTELTPEGIAELPILDKPVELI